jgi:hypothetical protein
MTHKQSSLGQGSPAMPIMPDWRVVSWGLRHADGLGWWAGLGRVGLPVGMGLGLRAGNSKPSHTLSTFAYAKPHLNEGSHSPSHTLTPSHGWPWPSHPFTTPSLTPATSSPLSHEVSSLNHEPPSGIEAWVQPHGEGQASTHEVGGMPSLLKLDSLSSMSFYLHASFRVLLPSVGHASLGLASTSAAARLMSKNANEFLKCFQKLQRDLTVSLVARNFWAKYYGKKHADNYVIASEASEATR